MSSFSSQKTKVQYLVGFTSLLQSELHDFFSHISDFLRYKFVITSPVVDFKSVFTVNQSHLRII